MMAPFFPGFDAVSEVTGGHPASGYLALAIAEVLWVTFGGSSDCQKSRQAC